MSEAHSNKIVGDKVNIQAIQEIAENIREASELLSLSDRSETRCKVDVSSRPATQDSPSLT
jgi:hypothetical protein